MVGQSVALWCVQLKNYVQILDQATWRICLKAIMISKEKSSKLVQSESMEIVLVTYQHTELETQFNP